MSREVRQHRQINNHWLYYRLIFLVTLMNMFRNKKILTTGKILLAGIILWGLMKSSQIDISLFANVFRNPINLVGYASSLIVIYLCMVFLGAWRWYLLNSAQNIPLKFTQLIKPTYIASAFNLLLPGAVGGDFVRGFYVFKLVSDKKSQVLLTIFFDRVIGLMGVIATLCLVALMDITFFYKQHELFYLVAITIIFCVGLFVIFLALMIFPQRLGLHAWLANKFPENKFVQIILHYMDAFSNYRIPKLTLFKTIAASVLIQFLLVLTLMVIAAMMGLPLLPFSNYAIAAGITLLVNLIPITPGGIGMGEMAFANVLLLLNPHSSIPFATIYLCYRVICMLVYAPALLFYLPSFKLLQRKKFELETNADI